MSGSKSVVKALEQEGAESVDVQQTADDKLIITMDLPEADDQFECVELEFDSVEDVIAWMRRRTRGEAE